MKTIHLIISGMVQGVGYRQWMKRKARQLGLVGWVKNRLDGSVEVLASGDTKSIDELLTHARSGPMRDRVTDIQCETVTGYSSKEFIVIQ